jgi:3',5'-cyclic AMP phosphodiesterase CpdA
MRIAIISDTHIAYASGAVYANLLAVRAWTEAISPRTTLHLGDVTADGAQHPEQLDFAARFFAGWPGPIRLLAGNHDTGDNDDIARSASEPAIDAERLARFQRALGPSRFQLTFDRWMLIGLNAQLLGSGGEEAAQDVWLDAALTGVNGPLGLFLHKPLFLGQEGETPRHARYVPPEPRARLLARLKRRDLRFVVSGHAHQLRRRVFDGVEHVWVPSCAFVIPDAMQEVLGEKTVGVISLTPDRDRHDIQFVVPPGVACHNLLDQADIYPQLRTNTPS